LKEDKIELQFSPECKTVKPVEKKIREMRKLREYEFDF